MKNIIIDGLLKQPNIRDINYKLIVYGCLRSYSVICHIGLYKATIIIIIIIII